MDGTRDANAGNGANPTEAGPRSARKGKQRSRSPESQGEMFDRCLAVIAESTWQQFTHDERETFKMWVSYFDHRQALASSMSFQNLTMEEQEGISDEGTNIPGAGETVAGPEQLKTTDAAREGFLQA